MQKVDIPGGTATIRDSVTYGGRQLVEQTVVAAGRAFGRKRKLREQAGLSDEETDDFYYTEEELEAINRYMMAGMIAWLKHWTIDEPLPTTIEDVKALDPDIVEPIIAVTGPLTVKALKRVKVDSDSAVTEDGKIIIDSPTGPSTATEGGERASTSTSSENGTAPSSPQPESSTIGSASAD